jgi:hypothetical protein
VVQPEYWDLLFNVISDEIGSAIKDWLRLFVARTPLYHIFTSYFVLLPQVEERTRITLEILFESNFQILWPMISKRASAENLLDCFVATFPTLSDPTTVVANGTQNVVGQICTAYQKSLPAASNRKKVLLLCFSY